MLRCANERCDATARQRMNYGYATLTDSREDYNHNELFNTDVTPRRARGEIRSERRDSTTDGARTFFSSRSSCTNYWL